MFRRLLRNLFRVFLLVIVLSAATVAWVYFTLPDVRTLKTQFPVVKYQGPDLPSLVFLQKARPKGWVNLGEVSKIAVAAIVISEDSAFYQHKGIDYDQLKESAQEDWDEKRFARGGSTITQQVVRNVYLTKEKSLIRKAKELYLAPKLDEQVGKKRTLEVYLNVAEWGPGIFGIRSAAQYYFSKSPAELTAKEGAFLAMLLPSPIRYGQSFRKKRLTAYAEDTVETILRKLTQSHHLTEDQRIVEMNTPLPFEKSADPLSEPLPRPSEEPDAI